MIGDYHFLPCTPAGVMELLASEDIDVCGKNCVVIGRSNIVGKPMSMLLLHKNGTVTICHSRTRNLAETTRQADILIAAVGIAKFVKADMVKPGAVVIDVRCLGRGSWQRMPLTAGSALSESISSSNSAVVVSSGRACSIEIIPVRSQAAFLLFSQDISGAFGVSCACVRRAAGDTSC